MAWTIDFTPKAKKAFAKLDKTIVARIDRFLMEKVAVNPKIYGNPLSGTLSGLWSFRTGNYRVLATLEDERLVVLVMKIGHRRDAYGGH